MILIISEKEDFSTSEVIQWLIYYKVDFFRVNRGDILTLKEVHILNSNPCRFILHSADSRFKCNRPGSFINSVQEFYRS